MVDLQTAGLWKRIASGLFDGILSAVLAVGIAFLLSAVMGYDRYSDQVAASYEKYEKIYSVDLDISSEQMLDLSEKEREAYFAASMALLSDEEAMRASAMTVNLSLIIVSISILCALTVWEFILPLVFKNGQTLGKKIFGICLMRTDCVKISTVQLLVRTLFGKYTLETMLPVFSLMTVFLGIANAYGLFLLASLILLAVQIVMFFVTRTNSCIHDRLAMTVVVDMASQMIFETPEDLLEFKKKEHADQVNVKNNIN